MMRKVLLLLLLPLIVQNGFCQKVKTVEGEYTYHVPENVSLAEAKRYALKQAQLNAIANEFGTVVERTNLTRVENSSKASETRFVSLGSSDVKGEWIGFIGFVKAVDAASGKAVKSKRISGYPRELSFEDFHQWLGKCRRHDKEMTLKKMVITIRK